MKKFLLSAVCGLMLIGAQVFAVPATNVQIQKGDNDGYYSYFVTTGTAKLVIPSNTVPTAAIPDWVIQNYSTNTYNIEISTSANFREATLANPGNYWTMVPGESYSPAGTLLYAPIYVRVSGTDGSVRQRVQVNKFKYSQIR